MQAVAEYLADAKAREFADATLYKLENQLRKQLLSWCKAEGYRLLKEFDLRAAQSFRACWTDGALAKKKKQERLTGFFWFCIRAGWLTEVVTKLRSGDRRTQLLSLAFSGFGIVGCVVAPYQA